MNIRFPLLLSLALGVSLLRAPADDQINKLVAMRDNAERAELQKQNKRLQLELEKLRIMRQKAGDKPGVAAVELELSRVKARIEAARQPANGSVNPEDIRIFVGSNTTAFLARPEDCGVAEEKTGSFRYQNTSKAVVVVMIAIPLKGAFQAELQLKGPVATAGIGHIELASNLPSCFADLPAKQGLQKITIERTAEGLLAVAQDGVSLPPKQYNTGTPGMPCRMIMAVPAEAEVEFRELRVLDLSQGSSNKGNR